MQVLLALVLGATLVAPAGAPGDRDQPRLADRLERAVSVAGGTRDLAAWQHIADRTGGTRATGTPGFALSADYLVHRLTGAGYRVTRQPVPYQDFHVDAERVTEVAPKAAPIRTYLLRSSP